MLDFRKSPAPFIRLVPEPEPIGAKRTSTTARWIARILVASVLVAIAFALISCAPPEPEEPRPAAVGCACQWPHPDCSSVPPRIPVVTLRSLRDERIAMKVRR